MFLLCVYCLTGFRDFKDCGGKRIPDTLKPLLTAVGTLVVSTAACERGFSQMNVVMDATRCSLNVARLSKLLFVKCNGPPLARFKPDDYVRTWLTKRHSAADDSKARASITTDKHSAYDSLWSIF